MRRINGSGSVYKLKDKPRHKPWVAMSSKKNAYGVTEKKVIGYYETKKEAVTALDAFNVDPYAPTQAITFKDIYKLWEKEFAVYSAPKTVSDYSYAWKHWEPFYDRPIREVRVSELQQHMDASGAKATMKITMKKVMSNVYEFAVKNDYCPKNSGSYLHVPSRPDGTINPHKVYTDDEINKLWEHQEDPYAALQLILIYSGARVGEVLDLKEADIDLEAKTFTVRASKTNAGIRTVPIADKVYHLWQKHMVHGWGLTYQTVKKKWDAYTESIGLDHTPHDARHTAISRMSAAHVNYVLIKKIVGHKTGDVTEDIYTHFSMDELRDAINKI